MACVTKRALQISVDYSYLELQCRVMEIPHDGEKLILPFTGKGGEL